MGSQTASTVIDNVNDARATSPQPSSSATFRPWSHSVALPFPSSRSTTTARSIRERGVRADGRLLQRRIGHDDRAIPGTVCSRAGLRVVSVLREHADTVIRLRHADGWAMPALISDSVLIRENEKLAVVAFTDLTEISWHTSPNDELLPGSEIRGPSRAHRKGTRYCQCDRLPRRPVMSTRLADFVVDRRMLVITAFALPIGALSAGAAWCLVG